MSWTRYLPLPFENYTLVTKLSTNDIQQRIANNLENPKFGFLKMKFSKPYNGRVEGNKFKITRNISGRNSFIPQITGDIVEGTDKTIVSIKMRLHYLVVIFICFWVSFVGGTAISFKDPFNAGNILPAFASTFIFVVIPVSFSTEVTESKKFLSKLLEDENTML